MSAHMCLFAAYLGTHMQVCIYVSNYALKKTIKSPCGVRIIIMVLCNFALRTPYVYIKRKEKTTTYARTHKSICIQWRPHRVSSPLSCASRKHNRALQSSKLDRCVFYIYLFSIYLSICVQCAPLFFADLRINLMRRTVFVNTSFFHTHVCQNAFDLNCTCAMRLYAGALRRRGNIDCFSWKIFK